MAGTDDLNRASKPEERSTHVDDGAESDEEEFHDARFPADEEAVSCRDGCVRECELIFAVVTESLEGSPRYKGRGQPAVQRRML